MQISCSCHIVTSHQTENTSTTESYFWNIRYHVQFEGPKLSGANITSTSWELY
jgi:hypothetical protein